MSPKVAMIQRSPGLFSVSGGHVDTMNAGAARSAQCVGHQLSALRHVPNVHGFVSRRCLLCFEQIRVDGDAAFVFQIIRVGDGCPGIFDRNICFRIGLLSPWRPTRK